MTEQTKIFISYSRQDKGQIDQLYQALSGDDELEVFLDEYDIAAAEDWKERLESLIRSADTVIFATSSASTTSDICRWEVEQAASLNKRILPVILEDVLDGNVPDAIARLNYIFLRNEAEFKPALISIGEALKVDVEWVREHTRLAELAHRWDLATQLGAQPLRGKELEAAESWLASQPKDAPQPTEEQRRYIYQSRKAATRRQRITVAGSLAALVVVGVLGTFAWFQRNEAVGAQNRAVLALEVSNDTAGKMAIDMIDAFKGSSVPIEIRALMLKSVVDLLNELNEGFENPALTRRNTWVVNKIQSDHQLDLGELQTALTFAKSSLTIANRGLETEPETALLLADKAASLMSIANIYNLQDQQDLAWDHILEAIAIAQQSHDLDPDNLRIANDLIIALSQRTVLSFDQDKTADLEQSLDAALDMARDLARQHPDDTTIQVTMLALLGNLAEWKADSRDAEAVRSLLDERAVLSRSLLANDPANADYQESLARALIGKERRMLQMGMEVDSGLLSEGFNIWLGLTKIDPENVEWLNGLATALEAIGGYFENQDNDEEALNFFVRVLMTARELVKLSPDSVDHQRGLAVALEDVVRLNLKLDRPDQMLEYAQESLEISKALAAADPDHAQRTRDVAISWHWIGSVYAKIDQPDEAIAAHEASVTIMRDAVTLDPQDFQLLGALASKSRTIAVMRIQRGDYLQAAEFLVESADIYGRMAALQPENATWSTRRISTLSNASAAFAKAKDQVRAYQVSQVLVEEKREQLRKKPDDATVIIELSNALGGSAWYAILAREYEASHTASIEAITLNPDPLWLQTNLAHALMLQGQTDMAIAVYLDHKGQVSPEGDKWSDTIRGDFDILEANGISVPTMQDVLSLLAK